MSSLCRRARRARSVTPSAIWLAASSGPPSRGGCGAEGFRAEGLDAEDLDADDLDAEDLDVEDLGTESLDADGLDVRGEFFRPDIRSLPFAEGDAIQNCVIVITTRYESATAGMFCTT